MIRITIIAIATFVLGFAAFTGVDHYTGAQAAPPPKTPTPTPGPAEPLHVIEQNLDANGNIKVAQQGPVDVNVVSGGRTSVIQIADGFVVPNNPNVFYTAPFVDVSDCQRIDLFVEATSSGVGSSAGTIYFDLMTSIDGVQPFSSIATGAHIEFAGGGSVGPKRDASTVPFNYPEVASPFVALRANNWDLDLSGISATVSAWLYCTPVRIAN